MGNTKTWKMEQNNKTSNFIQALLQGGYFSMHDANIHTYMYRLNRTEISVDLKQPNFDTVVSLPL